MIQNLTIKSFHDGLVAKKFSALEAAQALFASIKKTDPEIHAYLSLDEAGAARAAEAVDLAIARGDEVGALAGVPLAIKDNILIKGLPATAASKILEHYTAAYDAHVIEKLKAEQAVFLGKTNLDEFAMGSSTENSAFGPTKNPHDTTRVPGGSSGGSAAAVAAHEALAALGTDTGGSIRLPASFCGVVGLSPTYGAVSRSGAIAMASSLDQIGPLAKTVEDAALLFKAIAGADPLDATSVVADYDGLLKPKIEDVKKLTVGIPKEYFAGELSPEVRAGMDRAIEKMKKLGLKFKEISLPHTKYALSCYYVIVPAEVSSNLARFDGIRYARISNLSTESGSASGEKSQILNLGEIYLKQKGVGFGPESKRRIILGTFVLSSGYYDAYYEKAQRVRTLVTNDFETAFKEVDVIFAPVAPAPAFKLGEKTNDPLAMYLADMFTIPMKMAGLPAISIPVEQYAYPSAKLPIGFQLVGKWWREADILGIGQLYEELSK
ncbi:MAG TPA: Asp-tRNA(Asn)/Glu-tRNA(Gln) amidotransferase subunit GatA [Candidatus Paceibacterota bacterium]|nr:Asp-tRNA(Asn)/Glu-tRNA(Gln) amidotransferase subunit GatA [Candidatus Paceibacterota bacterium]